MQRDSAIAWSPWFCYIHLPNSGLILRVPCIQYFTIVSFKCKLHDFFICDYNAKHCKDIANFKCWIAPAPSLIQKHQNSNIGQKFEVCDDDFNRKSNRKSVLTAYFPCARTSTIWPR